MAYFVQGRDNPNYVHIAGAPGEDLSTARERLVSATLGGLAAGKISMNQANELTRDAACGNFILVETFKALATSDIDTCLETRSRSLLAAASTGALTAQQVLRELEAIQEWPLHITGEGLDAEVTAEGFIPCYEAWEPGNEPEATNYEAGKAVGATAESTQYELVFDEEGSLALPRLLSDRQHDSYGVVNEAGIYEPRVTVLDDGYIRMQLEQREIIRAAQAAESNATPSL